MTIFEPITGVLSQGTEYVDWSTLESALDLSLLNIKDGKWGVGSIPGKIRVLLPEEGRMGVVCA